MVKISASTTLTYVPEPKDGDPGNDAVVWRLIPSYSAVTLRRNGVELVPDVANLTLRVTKQTGVDTPVTIAPANWAAQGVRVEYTFNYGDDFGISQPYNASSGINVNVESSSVTASLVIDNVEVDAVTIPFVADGADGTDGENAVTYELMCLNPTIHIGSDDSISPSIIAVFPFKIDGITRSQLPVNNDTGANHYLILRVFSNSESCSLGSAFSSRKLKSKGSYPRFDLVAKTDVTDITTYSYPESAILASIQINVQRDGIDGSSGAITSIVFTRSETKPAKPTGGTYTNPVPTTQGWSDTPEAGEAPLWMSKARFEATTTDPNWSEPSPVVDSTGIEFIFSPVENPTAPANTHPYEGVVGGDWSKNENGAIWMAVAVQNAGVWSDWSVTKIKGESGKDAITINVIPENVVFKSNGITQRVKIYIEVYKGEQLIPYSDTGFICSTLGSGAQGAITDNLSWHFIVESGKFCYRLTYNGTGTVDMEIPFTVYLEGKSYSRRIFVKSVDNGEKGARGPSLRGPQLWDEVPVGFEFESGGEDDEFLDCVIYGPNKDVYICKTNHTKVTTNGPTSVTAENNELWRLSTKFEVVATRLLLAEYAVIRNLGVEALEMYARDADGEVVLNADGTKKIIAYIRDGKIVINTGEFNNVVFSGIAMKKRTEVTATNFSSIFKLEADSENQYDIDLKKCGTWLDIKYLPKNIIIYPKNMRAFCGNVLLFYNNSSHSFSISTLTTSSFNGSPGAFSSFTIAPGQFASLECKIGAKDGQEIAYFLGQKGTINTTLDN